MCYGDFCKTVDPEIPIYCPDCLADNFFSLSEDDLMAMYHYFINNDDILPEVKELFFESFNKLLLIKRQQLKPDTGDNDDIL